MNLLIKVTATEYIEPEEADKMRKAFTYDKLHEMAAKWKGEQIAEILSLDPKDVHIEFELQEEDE
jgi:hypothetical protein